MISSSPSVAMRDHRARARLHFLQVRKRLLVAQHRARDRSGRTWRGSPPAGPHRSARWARASSRPPDSPRRECRRSPSASARLPARWDSACRVPGRGNRARGDIASPDLRSLHRARATPPACLGCGVNSSSSFLDSSASIVPRTCAEIHGEQKQRGQLRVKALVEATPISGPACV